MVVQSSLNLTNQLIFPNTCSKNSLKQWKIDIKFSVFIQIKNRNIKKDFSRTKR